MIDNIHFIKSSQYFFSFFLEIKMKWIQNITTFTKLSYNTIIIDDKITIQYKDKLGFYKRNILMLWTIKLLDYLNVMVIQYKDDMTSLKLILKWKLSIKITGLKVVLYQLYFMLRFNMLVLQVFQHSVLFILKRCYYSKMFWF